MNPEVAGLRDVVTFQGRSVEEIEESFRNSVEDYLEFCEERGFEWEMSSSHDAFFEASETYAGVLGERGLEEYRRRGRPEDAMEVMWEEFARRPHLENYRKLKSCTDRLEDWVMWRKKALDRVREQTSALKGSRWFPADHSTLVGIFLWERRYDEAWREAVEGGCSPGLWLRLAAAREVDHPEDAICL